MDKIIIKGARENNLKNINIELPKDKLIVMTGVSGSGKSSSNSHNNRRDMFESNNQFYLDEYWDILNRIKREKVFASFYYDSRINKGDKCFKSESSSSHTTSLADEYESMKRDRQAYLDKAKEAADMDNDGNVSASDARKILRIAAKLE